MVVQEFTQVGLTQINTKNAPINRELREKDVEMIMQITSSIAGLVGDSGKLAQARTFHDTEMPAYNPTGFAKFYTTEQGKDVLEANLDPQKEGLFRVQVTLGGETPGKIDEHVYKLVQVRDVYPLANAPEYLSRFDAIHKLAVPLEGADYVFVEVNPRTNALMPDEPTFGEYLTQQGNPLLPILGPEIKAGDQLNQAINTFVTSKRMIRE